MKKISLFLGMMVFSSTTLIGVGNVVKAAGINPNPNQAETPITAKLTLNEHPQKPTPPTGGQGGADQVTNIDGLFGIAYEPKTLSGQTQLKDSGSQNVPLSNNDTTKYNIGVEDKTRENDQTWKLKAKLSWKGDTNRYMAGSTITTKDGNVQENKNGTLEVISGSMPVNNMATNLTISQDSEVDIMEAVKGNTMNGVYNYQFDNPQLVIPDVSKVPAGAYSGTINWDLENTPSVR